MYKLLIILLAILIPLPGCYVLEPRKPEMPKFHYINPNHNLSTLGRVAIIELDNLTGYPQYTSDITQTLYRAIQKEQVFGATLFPRSAEAWRVLNIDLEQPLTHEQMAVLRNSLNANAILFGQITEYKPFPHLSIGLRLRLLDLKNGSILWGIEHIWDSNNQKVEQRIAYYARTQLGTDLTPFRRELISQSPIEFTTFVAYEVAQTLNPEGD